MNTDAVTKLLEQSGADALIISSAENIFYISGFTSADAELVITSDKKLIFTDSRYYIQAAEEAPDFELVDIAKKTVFAYLAENDFAKIGFEDEYVTYAFYKKLSGSSEKSEFFGISRQLDKIRQIKTEYEAGCIKKAASIADEAFSRILSDIAPGKTENDIAAKLEFYMKTLGASGTSFETVCASGVRSAMPHGTASNKVIEKGDFLVLDFGCLYKGYCSDMTRTVVVGKATDEQKKIYDTVLSAQLAALSVIAPGIKNAAIDKTARDIIKNAGYGDKFGHALGHSVGLKIHEMPVLSPKSSDVLKSGIIMTVEPGIYIENFGGVRIEDLVYITENGYINFTSSEKGLLEIN